MLNQFESNIIKSGVFTKKHKLLLAISGGVDSVVLAYLLKNAGYNFCLAHCNFKLRGKESDDDEKFCKALAAELGIKIFIKAFNTKRFSVQNKLSIQMAARKLRYDWFEEVMQENKLNYLLTAHHANDVIETVFINLLRGTGINGLKGILEKNEKIIRPLVNVSKNTIETYAKKYKLKFRVDSSNLDDKYERNFLRLNIIPKLKELNAGLEKTFSDNSFRFNQEAGIVNDFLEAKTKDLLNTNKEEISINKKKLGDEKYPESILYFALKPFGFNKSQRSDIIRNVVNDSLVGKNFQSETHRLTIDRKAIIIRQNKQQLFKEVKIASIVDLKNDSFFKTSTVKKFSLPGMREVLLNENDLEFPLTYRNAKKGDKFIPFGMTGFKLLSDFFKDQKLNVFEKENCKVLVNGNDQIIWVVGYRSDNRYKVDAGKKKFLKLSLLGE